jgi:HNH endonuclease
MRPATILPSAEVLRECFDYDPETGTLTWRRRPIEHFNDQTTWKIWNTRYSGKEAGKKTFQRSTRRAGARVVLISIQSTSYKTSVHRIVLAINEIAIPSGMVVDHINGDAFDNRLSNLRVCTHAQNIRNNPGYRTRNGTKRSLPKGVYKNTKGFQAMIRHNGKLFCLGTYPTTELASAVYQAKAKELHGEFYREDCI